MLILVHEPPSLLQQRFVKTTVKKDSISEKLFKNLQNVLRPLSRKNVQSGQYVNKTKKLLLQAGYASSEDDVIKYDSRRLANVLITFGFLCVLLILSFSVEVILISILALFFGV